MRTAAVDAHSGLYGGAALARHALLEILAAVMPRDGRLLRRCRRGRPRRPGGGRRLGRPPGRRGPRRRRAAPRRSGGRRRLLHAHPGLAVARRPWARLRRAQVRSRPASPARPPPRCPAARRRTGRGGLGRGARRPPALRRPEGTEVTIEGLGLAARGPRTPATRSWPRRRGRDGGGNQVAPGAGAEQGTLPVVAVLAAKASPRSHRLRAARRRDPRPRRAPEGGAPRARHPAS